MYISGIKRKFVIKLTIELNKNRDRLSREVKQNKELMRLLNKSRSEKLSEEEKKVVRDQLVEIIKMIPALAYFALPGSFITLPLLLKVLPKNILPNLLRD